MYDFDKEYNSYYRKQGMYIEYKGERKKAIRIAYNDICILWKTKETYICESSKAKYLCNFYREYFFTYPNVPRTTNDLESKMIYHYRVKINQNNIGYYVTVDGRRYYIGDLKNYAVFNS